MNSRKDIRVQIERFNPECDSSPYLKTYELEFEDGMNVLRLLTRIYEEVDHSLGYMGPCKIGFCGLCKVNVNGDDVMACQRVIKQGESEIVIRPVSRDLVIRDLAVRFNNMTAEEREEK